MKQTELKDQYIVLTGSMNNAGDFLIKHRAKLLLKKLRPDRKIIDWNAWEHFDKNKIKEVNQSRALILLGGPALQVDMRPRIYPMTENLADIKAPIITMGIGWKSDEGSWSATADYLLNQESLELMKRINSSGYLTSVRDYHTQNSLFNKGYEKIMMTGCPALYNYDFIGSELDTKKPVKKIAFSTGVAFINSYSMEQLMKKNILALRREFQDKEFEVVFHHSIDPIKYRKIFNAKEIFLKRHLKLADWLKKNDIKYVDVSGAAQSLMDYYSQVDLHVGYRVHAHIYMSSISKPSLLISEDGRGKALRDVIGGLIIDGYINRIMSRSRIIGLLSKFRQQTIDTYITYDNLPQDIIHNLKYEMKNEYPRMSLVRNNIDHHLQVMENFIRQLP